mgnify:CR=1 FL=1
MIVPELHDIGKLVDKRVTGIKHNFENAPFRLENDTWRGIVEHHCSRNFQKYPTSPDTFKLCIADDLAAAFSRYVMEGEDTHVFNTHKLWNPPSETMTQSFIKSTEEVKELFSFLAKNPTANDFFEKYENMLKKRTEHATRGKNITSLYTHSKLTGQFFRILTSDNSTFSVKLEELQGLNKEEVATLINKKKKTWNMSVMRCKFNFAQMPVRAKDMNIFKALEKLIDDIKKELPDNIFFSTSNELLIVASNVKEPLERIRKKIEDLGFWVDVAYAETQVGGIKPQLEDIRGKKDKMVMYPPLLNEISPPICELCQISKAKDQPWVDVESGIKEFLCEKCWKIRETGSSLPKFVEWEASEKNPKIGWLKIWLDYELLLKNLSELYSQYLNEIREPVPKDQIEIRFSTISEFQWDYDKFLKYFEDTIEKDFSSENVQKILPDFLAVQIDSFNLLRHVLQIFNELYDAFFPKFKDISSPLKLSIVGSNIKFPFLEIWRLLQDTKNEINIQLIGKGYIGLKVKDLSAFLKTKTDNKALLYKLVKMSEISPKLAKITLNDRSDRDFHSFTDLRLAVDKFGFENMLTYAKMMGD